MQDKFVPQLRRACRRKSSLLGSSSRNYHRYKTINRDVKDTFARALWGEKLLLKEETRNALAWLYEFDCEFEYFYRPLAISLLDRFEVTFHRKFRRIIGCFPKISNNIIFFCIRFRSFWKKIEKKDKDPTNSTFPSVYFTEVHLTE